MDSELRLGNGRYLVRRVLGEGAQGTTYDATDSHGDRSVAIKHFNVRGAHSWKEVELAEREARVLATLDHPLMPRYIEHFEEDGALYLVMEKIEGETLDAIRRREGPLPEDEVRRFLACADRALTYLHGRSSPIVHRDIKPRNVLRRPDGSYVFVDFGTVSELMLRRGGSTVAGTIGYMAPEQLQGRALPATDVYAVGATALAALTGAEPETLRHRGLRIDVREALRGRASPAMTSALEQMLEPDPDARATSVGAVLDGVRSQAASIAPAGARFDRGSVPAGPLDRASEDAAVKSIRSLLWVLWALGWIIVPLVASRFGAGRMTPTVMFTALAALLIVTWHKGAGIRAALRALSGGERRALAPEGAESTPRQRVGVSGQRQVRVHTSELRAEELVGETVLEDVEPDRRAGRK